MVRRELARCARGVLKWLLDARVFESSFTHSSRNYLLLIVILFAHAYTSLKYLKLILFLVVVVLEIVVVVVIDVAEFILLLARLRHEWKLHLFRILIEPI